ncbi:Flp family type IVb pilin [Sphingorhabdus sp.]|jgi:pilus assembly protein Flp/PilA|uniref:Flp family type IVb pilin n=1 Tax=Sphingorhabdus sp. TaxID=1902408 RepID=UPI0037832189
MLATKDRRGTNKMLERIRRIHKCDQGATAVEYGLIAALVAVAAIVGMTTLGTNLNRQLSAIANTLTLR